MSWRTTSVGLWCALGLLGCARYSGPSHAVIPAVVDGDGWESVPEMALVRQRSDGECGQAALSMVLSHWGTPTTLEDLQAEVPLRKAGLRASEVRDTLQTHGLKAFVIEGTLTDLEHELAADRPVIVGTVKKLNNKKGLRHFEVVVAISRERQLIVTLDPSLGWRKSSFAGFESEWSGSAHTAIVALPSEVTASTL